MRKGANASCGEDPAQNGLARDLTATWLALVLAGCGLTSTRGTMPPGDASGEVDPNSVPDFIAYVGRTDRIIGWIPKAYILDPFGHCGGRARV